MSEGKRQPGSMKGKLHVGAEFFDPLPDDELSAWAFEPIYTKAPPQLDPAPAVHPKQ